MKYRKPEIIDLGASMQRANGQEWPSACISGVAAGGEGESCGTGGSAGFTCASGTEGPGGDLCVGGSSPGGSMEDCFAGSSAFYCGSGSGGGSDPMGCRVGPSFS